MYTEMGENRMLLLNGFYIGDPSKPHFSSIGPKVALSSLRIAYAEK
jgi:hypothetical protein